MKNTICLFILFMCSSLYTTAQEELVINRINQKLNALQTTQAEYDYMMEGYAKQVKFGLNMKKGYRLENKYSAKIKGFSFTSHDLVRTENDQYVGTIIYAKASNGQEEYIAIPYLNEELMDIHKVHLGYILRKKLFGAAYSEFHSRRMATTASAININ